ncbi:MAG: hypothetical protein ACE5G9_07725 [Nitrospinales bacterium]
MKKTRKNILFALAAILLVFAVLEGGSRLYQRFTSDELHSVGRETLAFAVDDLSPYVLFRPLPSLELRPGEKYFFDFDGVTVTAEKPPGEYRIFIMGGSVAKGYGASAPDKKFYRILETLLNENRPEQSRKHFKVISAGRLGYVSAQELILLLMGIFDFHPDMVIHLNGANDIIAVAQRQESPGYPFYFQSLKKALKAVTLERQIDQTLGKSAFLSALGRMFKKYRTSIPDLTATNITRHYTRNMRQTAQFLSANGIETFFILQPVLLYKKEPSPGEQALVNNKTAQSVQIWKTTYPRLAETLKTISGEEKIHWRDFRGAFDTTGETVFTDSVHFNNRGQGILAHALFEAIKTTAYGKE